MNIPIPLNDAKEQLARMDEILDTPHLLIGGIAVNQYITSRDSRDIDLVCSYDVSKKILKDLFPTSEWEISDPKDNEYRPSYEIKSRVNDAKITFGAKIKEREQYKNLNWEALIDNARPFRYSNKQLNKILVPSPAALCFTKILSFMSRSQENTKKIEQDFQDIIDLSNNRDFGHNELHNLIEKTGNSAEIKRIFNSKIGDRADLLHMTFVRVASLFGLTLQTVISEPDQQAKLNNEYLSFELLANSDSPVVVSTFPPHGSIVEPGEVDIKVTFSHEMMQNSYSYVSTPAGISPEYVGKPNLLDGGKTFYITAKLVPTTKYIIWFNTSLFHNFKSRQGIPAVPFFLCFETSDSQANSPKELDCSCHSC
jgi:hypothetical protein